MYQFSGYLQFLLCILVEVRRTEKSGSETQKENSELTLLLLILKRKIHPVMYVLLQRRVYLLTPQLCLEL